VIPPDVRWSSLYAVTFTRDGSRYPFGVMFRRVLIAYSIDCTMQESPESADADLVDAVLTGSRAMIAVAVRSLSGLAEDITLAQYRTLVVLASRGPQKLADLAACLGVTPPTAGRMCDRLARRELVGRHREEDDRRVVRISLTPAGRDIVDEATRQRRVYIAEILAGLPPARRREAAAGLRAFAEATGEVPDSEWPGV